MKHTSYISYFLQFITLGCLFLTVASAHGIRTVTGIDDFGNGSSSIRYPDRFQATGTKSQSENVSNVLGGNRETTFQVQRNPFYLPTQLRINFRGDGFLKITNALRAESITRLRYDGGGAGLGGIDLLAGNAEGFGLQVNASDPGLQVVLRVTDQSGQQSSATFMKNGRIQTTEWLKIDFATFLGNADLSDVDEIELEIIPRRSGDVSINAFAIVAVPEPSSSIFCITSLLVFLSRRNRIR